MRIVRGGAVGDHAVRTVHNVSQARRDLGKRGRILYHGGGNAVDLLGAVPLAVAHGAGVGIKHHLPKAVDDGDRQALVPLEDAGELQVEKQHPFGVVSVFFCPLGIALGPALGQLLAVAVVAELAAVAGGVAALDTG